MVAQMLRRYYPPIQSPINRYTPAGRVVQIVEISNNVRNIPDKYIPGEMIQSASHGVEMNGAYSNSRVKEPT